jgi:sec-independent protein translocase protein TatC
MSATADQLFIDHVRELRRRLLWSVFCLVLASVAAFVYRSVLILAFTRPLHQSLIYTAPSGGLQFVFQICLAVGAVAALPVFLYQLLRFALPAFDQARLRTRGLVTIVAASYLLALSGVAFAYWLVLPMSFRFFASFDISGIRALISTAEYLSFVLGCVVTFAIIFQLPLLLLSYNRIDRFPPGALTKYRRHVTVGSLGLALLLPFTYDPLTQFVIAAPIIALYEVSILGVWMANRRYRASVGLPSVPSRGAQPTTTSPRPAAGLAALRAPAIDRRRLVRLG